MIKWTVLIFMLASTTILSAQDTNNIGENLIPFINKNAKWGYLDATTKEIIIKPIYDYAHLFKNGIAEVAIHNPQPKSTYENVLIGWIDTKGTEIFKPQLISIQEVKDADDKIINGYWKVYNAESQMGILSISGEWVVPLGKHLEIQFYNKDSYLADQKTLYHKGKIYQASKNTNISTVNFEKQLFYTDKGDVLGGNQGIAKWGGTVLLDAKYYDIQELPEYKRYVVSLLVGEITEEKMVNGDLKLEVQILNENRRLLKSFPASLTPNILSDGIVKIENNNQTKYINILTFQEVNENDINTEAGDYKTFVQKSHYGLKDKSGKQIVAPEYQDLIVYANQYVVFKKDKGFGLMDLGKKKELLPPIYRYINYLEATENFSIAKDEKLGVADTLGNIKIPMEYDYELYFNKNRAVAVKNGKQGVIDGEGKTLIPLEYEDISDLSEKEDNRLYTVKKSELWGLMNSDGKEILPCQYGYISFGTEKNWMDLQDETRQYRGLFNLETKVLIQPIYSSIYSIKENIVAAKRIDKNYHYQLLNPQGKPLSTDDYSTIVVADHYLVTIKKGKYGIMDYGGKILIENQYDFIWPGNEKYILVKKGEDMFYMDINGNEYKKE